MASSSPGPGTKAERGALIAAFCAVATLAAQVAGKAARDALFLSHLDVRSLPAWLVLASILSVGAAVLVARLMTRLGPARVVPAANVLSAALFLAEWALSGVAPRAMAIAVFATSTVLGPVLISGFWSLVGERFDPHTARKTFSRLGAGATLGGLLGGLLAERMGAYLPLTAVLVPLAALQLVTAWQLKVLAAGARPVSQPSAPTGTLGACAQAARSPHLRNIAGIVVLGTVAAVLVDFVFKARAADSLAPGQLLRFFAVFHTVVGLASLVAQAGFGRISLERLGLAGAIASLPMVVMGFGLAALAFPSLLVATVLRGAENVARNSIYRQGYEILYTPLPAHEKRALKVVVDVGLDRLGDALGGVLVALLLATRAPAETTLVIAAVLVSIAAAILSRRIERGHVDALENSLRTQAIALDLAPMIDKNSRATILQSLLRLRKPALESTAPAKPPSQDPWIERAAALRSGEAARARAALAQGPLPGDLVGLAIRLLAWDEVAPAADQALRTVAPQVTGQLVDALLDPDEAFAVRRRLPRVLASCTTQRTVDGLVAGLADRRFEVRYHCASALGRVRARAPERVVDEDRVHEAILRELAIGETVREEVRLLDDSEAHPLGTRASRGVEQVFLLLSLVLPAEPTRIAFSGIVGQDRHLRGTALEYLESILPERLRERLLPWLTREDLEEAA